MHWHGHEFSGLRLQFLCCTGATLANCLTWHMSAWHVNPAILAACSTRARQQRRLCNSQYGCYKKGASPVFRANDRLIGHHPIHPPSAGFGQ
jgi:hypothetical protein